LIGRDGVIRTHDPLHPMQVRYQAALRPDELQLYQEIRVNRPRVDPVNYSAIKVFHIF
jgi:hypothetical protein